MKFLSRLAMAGLSAGAGLIAAAPACASSTFFSDLGPGGSYNGSNGWTVSGPGFFLGAFAPAMGFTAAASGGISQIDLALGSIVASNPTTVSLWTDADGGLGTELGSWNVTPASIFGESSTVLTTISGISGVSLTAGDSYFLELTDSGSDFGAWNWNTVGYAGPMLENGVNSGSGEPSGAFDVLGSVPEPATWVMLIAGFGAVGWSLRRRGALVLNTSSPVSQRA